MLVLAQVVGQHLDRQVRREDAGADPREQHRGADDPENATRVLAGGGLREADRQEAHDGDQRAGQARHGGGLIGERGRLHAVHAGFHLRHHHLDGDDGVIHQQSQRDNQRAERDALEVPAHRQHHQRHAAQHQRHRGRDHEAGAPAQAGQAHRDHNDQRLGQRAPEVVNSILHRGGLVGHELQLHAVRKFRLDPGDCRVHRLAKVHDVAVAGHRDAEHQHWLAVVAHRVGRRILEATCNGRDVAELDQPAARRDGYVADSLFAGELATHAHHDAVAAGVDLACGQHRVLALEAFGDGQRCNAQRCQALVRELDIDTLGLLADEIDLLDHRHLQHLALDVLGRVRQVGVADAVTLDRVHEAVHVAVLVVQDRADHAVRHLEAQVVEFLARLVPGLALVSLGGAAAHGERHASVALPRVGDHFLEVVDLLEFLLHAVEDLVLQLLGGGARPDDHGGHGGHGKVRILELTEPGETEGTGHRDNEEHEQDDGAMAQRPVGEVEVVHRAACCVVFASTIAAPGSATFNPDVIFWIPAVTTNAPACGPETSTSSLR
ncbi:hypothetical protein D3C84_382720 [compost metagenome]